MKKWPLVVAEFLMKWFPVCGEFGPLPNRKRWVVFMVATQSRYDNLLVQIRPGLRVRWMPWFRMKPFVERRDP